MVFILPVIYALLLAFWLFRDKRFRLEAMPVPSVCGLFLLKCSLGVGYMLLHQSYYDGGDTMKYIRDGKVIYNTLFTDPAGYLKLTFGPNGLTDMPESLSPQLEAMGFWHDTSAYMMVRFNAVANLFTFGNEYGNIVIMALLSTLGMFWLIKAFTRVAIRPWWLLPASLLPSFLFWTSGVHKEGLLLFLLGGVVGCAAWLYLYGFSPKAFAGLVISLLFVYMLRDFVFFLLIPPLLALRLSTMFPEHKLVVFAGVYLVAVIVGLWIPVYHGGNYLHLILAKQKQFMALEAGNSQTTLKVFDPTLWGLIKSLPEALYNTVLGPFQLKPQGMVHVVAIMDNGLKMLVMVYGISRIRWSSLLSDSLALFTIFSGFSYLILIGYIVPNIGAISRYRSLAIPLILLGIYAHVNGNGKRSPHT